MGWMVPTSLLACMIDIKTVSESDAEESFNNRKNEPTWYGYKAKALRDFLIRRSLVNCIKLDATFMIHTGLGDSDIVAMECRPLMLWDLLTQDELMEINDIGPVAAKFIYEYFSNSNSIQMVQNLILKGVQISSNKLKEDTRVSNKTIVITGSLNSFYRRIVLSTTQRSATL